LHLGQVNFAGSKMSKSKGNVVLAKDAFKKWGRNIIF
jgi:cysteinyl-tRNA synthetase